MLGTFPTVQNLVVVAKSYVPNTFPQFKIFLGQDLVRGGVLVPNSDPGEPQGAAQSSERSFFDIFFTKLDPDPELGVLGGQAGSLKIWVDLHYHPNKNHSKIPPGSGDIQCQYYSPFACRQYSPLNTLMVYSVL